MLVLLPLAKRQLRKLPGDVADSMLDALEALVRDPRGRHNVTKLSGWPGAYRLRKGDFRATFRFDQERNVVVEAVDDRRDVYR